MKIIALDLEFNTVGKIQEIISVGAVVLDSNFNIIYEYENYIRLSLTNRLDPFAQKIHKIKKETLINAKGFEEVFEDLLDKINLKDDDVVITWGKNDKGNIISNAKYHGIESKLRPLTEKIYDMSYKIQKQIQYQGKPIRNRLSLETVCMICNIQQTNAHNALDDARCLAKIYKYAQLKEIISNDKIFDEILEKKKNKKLENQKRLNSCYETIDSFEQRYKYGIKLSMLSIKMIKQLKTIINDKKAKNNFKDISKKRDEIVVNDIYLVKENTLTDNTICSIKIKDRKLMIQFKKDDKRYISILFINKSTAECVKHLINASTELEINNINI